MRERKTRAEQISEKLGLPGPGLSWCAGYGREPHQVDAGEIIPNTCRCRSCRATYSREHYRKLHVVMVGPRSHRITHSQDHHTRRPGNDGNLVMPQWGYLGKVA